MNNKYVYNQKHKMQTQSNPELQFYSNKKFKKFSESIDYSSDITSDDKGLLREFGDSESSTISPKMIIDNNGSNNTDYNGVGTNGFSGLSSGRGYNYDGRRF